MAVVLVVFVGFRLMILCAKAAWPMARMRHQLENGKSIVIIYVGRTVEIEGMQLHKRGRTEGQRLGICRLSPVACIQANREG